MELSNIFSTQNYSKSIFLLWCVKCVSSEHFLKCPLEKIILEAPNKHGAHMCLQNLQFDAAKILPRGLENLLEINGQDNTFFVYTFDLD